MLVVTMSTFGQTNELVTLAPEGEVFEIQFPKNFSTTSISEGTEYSAKLGACGISMASEHASEHDRQAEGRGIASRHPENSKSIEIGTLSGYENHWNSYGMLRRFYFFAAADRHYTLSTYCAVSMDPAIDRIFESLKFVGELKSGKIADPWNRFGDLNIKNTNGAGLGSGPGHGSGSGTGGGLGTGQGSNKPRQTEREQPEETVNITKLRIYSMSKPAMTEEATANNVQGKVILRVVFLSNGRIGTISTIKGLPHGLTQQAIEAARKIKFEPEKRNGVPVTVTRKIEYTFTIY